MSAITKDWVIGEKHPIYGTVEMMGRTGGEAYRWFVDGHGCVSMIPLFMLQAPNAEFENEA